MQLASMLISFVLLQEMEKMKEELENMNDLMEQKDTLTQKLEVQQSLHYPQNIKNKTKLQRYLRACN